MRLFIAINLSDATKGSLINTQNALYDLGVHGNYTSEENLHLTLAFIGEYPNAEPVLDALSSVSFRPFELSLEGMGRFGDLWWAGIQDAFCKKEPCQTFTSDKAACAASTVMQSNRAASASHHNFSPIHKMKGHPPVRPNNHLLNDSVPPLRAECHLQMFQLPVKSFQGFPFFSPRAFLLLNCFALPLKCLIQALTEAVGECGTIMMPTQSWKNLDPEDGVHDEVAVEDWQIIRDNWPAYDKQLTPTNTMGAVAEMFRSWPGTIRSDHPARSVSAWGRHAAYLTEKHDLSNIFCDGSPIGKLYELDGWVLLIGVGYNKNTSLHLADARAEYPGKHNCIEHSAIIENGRRVWKAYETLFVDGEDFDQIGAAFEGKHNVHHAMMGTAALRLMRQRELVDFAVEWIEKNRR